jgi:hypothetical protein
MTTITKVSTNRGSCNACSYPYPEGSYDPLKRIEGGEVYELSFGFKGSNHRSVIRLCEDCLEELLHEIVRATE